MSRKVPSSTKVLDVIKMEKKLFRSSGRVTFRATGAYVKVKTNTPYNDNARAFMLRDMNICSMCTCAVKLPSCHNIFVLMDCYVSSTATCCNFHI